MGDVASVQPAELVAVKPNDEPAAGPVTGQERLHCVDSLRGIAVLGILVMNIYAFAMPFAAYTNPLLMGGTDTLNLGVWFVTHIFFDQKFMAIFSMLFGGGLIMMSERAEARGVRYGRFFYRRQLWLLLIGAVHAYLIWFGDILFVYAWVGMLAFLFRKRSPRFLIILACLLLPVASLFGVTYATSLDGMQLRAAEIAEVQQKGGELSDEDEKILANWEETRGFLAPTEVELDKDLTAYRGGYLDNLAHRAPTAAMMQVASFFIYGIWRVGALMLLGMALMKTGVLSGARSASFYSKLAIVGYGLGLPLAAFSAFDLFAHHFDGLYLLRSGGIPNYFGSILVALGHIGLVMWAIKQGLVQRAMTRFAAVGRMAITNYLMHSVVLTTIFYGFGFGLYGELPRISQMGFVVVVLGMQMIVSSWWLARYRFGPVEWLWRSLSYGRRQPMRR